jgi:hypothetical protein
MGAKYHKGDYIRWITGHSVYEAYDDLLVGASPIYAYGIVMEVSRVDPAAIVVHSAPPSTSPRLVLLSDEFDEIEVISSGGNL